MKDFGFLLAVVLAFAVLGFRRFIDRRRTAAIRALAIRSGFQYIGEALPRSLSLQGTVFERFSKVSNVIDGEPRGIRIIAFDCRVGMGKHSWERSVIAVEDGGDSLEDALCNSEMQMDSVGKWKIYYRPKASFEFRVSGLSSVEKLEACVNSIGVGAGRG